MESIIILIIALVIAVFIGIDASKRGMNAWGWGIGVALLWFVFIPLYFILRKPKLETLIQDQQRDSNAIGEEISGGLNLQNSKDGPKKLQMGIIIAIIGIALIIVSQTQEFTKTRSFDAGYGFTRKDVSEDTGMKNSILYFGIIALIIGGIGVALSFKSTNQSLNSSKSNLPSPKVENNSIEQLEKLNALREKGIITDEEFTIKKTELLSKL